MKKEFIVKKCDLNKEVTFIPIQQEFSFDSDQKQPPFALPFGQYDINFVIMFCHILIDKIDKMKFNPKDISFSLTHSLKRLLSMLEVEKDQMK